MITTLHIKNIGIIDDIVIDLNKGFNVITVNGNKIADLIQAFDKAKTTKGK